LALADAGIVVSLVDIVTAQSLVEAWGKHAAFRCVLTRQNRAKLDVLIRLVEGGQVKPVINAVLSLGRTYDAHQLLENSIWRGPAGSSRLLGSRLMAGPVKGSPPRTQFGSPSTCEK
jgi:hypothetical protein